MATRVFYSGDVNIEHGGFFYTLRGFESGYADVVQVTPCSDAGGPGNVFWVSSLAVSIPDLAVFAFEGKGDTAEARRAHRVLHNLPSHYEIECALATIGYDQALADWDKATVAERRHIVVYACVGYGRYDHQGSETVSLGKPEFTTNREGKWEPDKVLRANASLRNYARGKLK